MVAYGLKDKVVLITGTNNPKGMGAAMVLSYAKQGAKVAMVYKRMSFDYDEASAKGDCVDSYFKALSMDCSEVEHSISSHTRDYLAIESDISVAENIPVIFDKIEAKLGKVNILINNAAGYPVQDSIFNIRLDDIKSTYETTVQGTIMMIREFVKRGYGELIESGFRDIQETSMGVGTYKPLHTDAQYGRIVNFSTDTAQIMSGQLAYGSSKAAVEAFTRSIAMELGYLGITVNAIAPGPTQTGWMNPELIQRVLPDIPIARIGTPQDIADTVLFLTSDKASWVTGQVIKVSGGHGL
ncbi:3-oxoacyl-[acyl-carrier protein] reductase [Cyclobacterium lianum]|uniref:3-oxoacyl-[acyl-carrier protein] reductase n=2 Tax=Cyclobacterium lianum TaxID=388280 RepID=A0A1M7N3M8_9BACT|nr:3-oxoacyl-[acyl-carrier protein] reductase [Cyclobacterium lianum]